MIRQVSQILIKINLVFDLEDKVYQDSITTF